MMMRQITYISSLVFILLAGVTSVGTWFFLGTFNADAVQQSDLERAQELNALIKREIDTPSASAPTQCKLIPFGKKPCGGPADYLVYSTTKTNEGRLKQLVNEFNQLAEKVIREEKLISDCAYEREPKVELVGGICRIQGNSPRP